MTGRWHLLPVQVVALSDGLLLSRGTLTLRLGGRGVGEVVSTLLEGARQGPFLVDEILDMFDERRRPAVARLLDQLRERRLLLPAAADEQPDDAESVFFWNLDLDTGVVRERRAAEHLVVLGVNTVSRALLAALADPGRGPATVPELVDYLPLRALRLFDRGTLRQRTWPADLPQPRTAGDLEAALPEAGLVVATSDFGGAFGLRAINEACVDRGLRFLPVVLDRNVGQIGPLVLPGESPCYECLRARENATMADPEIERAVEHGAFDAQFARGAHPAMSRTLGDVAAFEIDAAVTIGSRQGVGHLLEIALMRGTMTRRPVLRVPRCTICSGAARRAGPALGSAAMVDRTGGPQ